MTLEEIKTTQQWYSKLPNHKREKYLENELAKLTRFDTTPTLWDDYIQNNNLWWQKADSNPTALFKTIFLGKTFFVKIKHKTNIIDMPKYLQANTPGSTQLYEGQPVASIGPFQGKIFFNSNDNHFYLGATGRHKYLHRSFIMEYLQTHGQEDYSWMKDIELFYKDSYLIGGYKELEEPQSKQTALQWKYIG